MIARIEQQRAIITKYIRSISLKEKAQEKREFLRKVRLAVQDQLSHDDLRNFYVSLDRNLIGQIDPKFYDLIIGFISNQEFISSNLSDITNLQNISVQDGNIQNIPDETKSVENTTEKLNGVQHIQELEKQVQNLNKQYADLQKKCYQLEAQLVQEQSKNSTFKILLKSIILSINEIKNNIDDLGGDKID